MRERNKEGRKRERRKGEEKKRKKMRQRGREDGKKESLLLHRGPQGMEESNRLSSVSEGA